MIRKIVTCTASIPLITAVVIQQTIPSVMLVALCGICCYVVFTNNMFDRSTSDKVIFGAVIALGVVLSALLHPILIIPSLLMVLFSMAPRKGSGKFKVQQKQRGF